MEAITDEFIKKTLAIAKSYTVVILKAGPQRENRNLQQIAWEHNRYNFAFRAEGLLVIICSMPDESDIKEIGIYTAGEEETRKIMDSDPGVMAGIFVYELYPAKSFPGDSLPLPGAGLNAFASLAG